MLVVIWIFCIVEFNGNIVPITAYDTREKCIGAMVFAEENEIGVKPLYACIKIAFKKEEIKDGQ